MSSRNTPARIQPPPIDDERVFLITRDRWPGARAVLRTKNLFAEFRVSAEPGSGRMHSTDRVMRASAVEIEGQQLGYCEGAQTIVVFQ